MLTSRTQARTRKRVILHGSPAVAGSAPQSRLGAPARHALARHAVVLGLVAVIATGLVAPKGASASPTPVVRGQAAGTTIDTGLTVVGSLPRVPPGLTIDDYPLVPFPENPDATGIGLPVVSAATGRLYQFFDVDADPTNAISKRVGVLVRDGGTTAIITSFLLPPAVKEVDDIEHRAGSELAHTLDTAGKRIFFWLEGDGQQERRQILILDETALEDPTRTKLVPLAAGISTAGLLSGLDVNSLNKWAQDQGTEVIRWTFDDLANWLGSTDLPPTPNIEEPPGVNTPAIPTPGSLGEPAFLAKPAGQLVFHGLTFSAGKLYLVVGAGGQDLPAGALLLELDAGPTLVVDDDGDVVPNPNLFQISWARPVRGCRSIGPSDFATPDRYSGFAPVLRTPTAFYVPCAASNTSIIVKLDAAEIRQMDGAEEVFTGTGIPLGNLIDEAGGRIFSRVYTPLGSAVLTFETSQDAYVGLQAVAAGTGATVRWLAWGLDPAQGRLYTQTPRGDVVGGKIMPEFGLGLTSGRFTPVQPPVTYPSLFGGEPESKHNIKRLPYDGMHRNLFLPDHGDKPWNQNFIVIHDAPPPLQPPEADPDSATKNVAEEDGKTGINFSGNASGYGVRELLVGGLDGLAPNRVIDAGGAAASRNHYEERPLCQRGDREIIFSRVENAKLDNSLQAALARPVQADNETREELRRPSRCTEKGNLGRDEGTLDSVVGLPRSAIETLRRTLNCSLCFALVDQVFATTSGTTGLGPPGLPSKFDEVYPSDTTREQIDQFTSDNPDPFIDAACRPDSAATTTGADPKYPIAHALNGFTASVDCRDPSQSIASASVTPVNSDLLPNTGVATIDTLGNTVEALTPSITVGSSSTSARTFRDPTRGTVSEVVSIVKGVTLAIPGTGAITIGGIYAEATTVAKGSPATARTSYTRLMWGVRAVTASGEIHCELCATEAQMEQFAEGLSAALGERGKAVIPKADAKLAAGSPGGYQAGIQRDPFVIITNDIVQGDSMKDLPALEIVLINDSVHWGRQRQIFQFAGVKANSQYGIICLGGGQPKDGHCVIPPRPPGSLTVALTDEKFKPLAEGEFSIGSQSCKTGGDGRCTMLNVPPGRYTVKQTAAPEGYLVGKDFPVQMSSGPRTINFVNLRNAAFINITLHDSSTGAPLPGGAFQVVADTNGSGVKDAKEAVVATCTSDSSGACPLKDATGKTIEHVSLGKYVVIQAVAPKSYKVADPVDFELAKPGEVADLAFTNGESGTAVLGLSGGQAAPVASIIPEGGGTGPFGQLANGLRWFAKNFWQMLLLGATVALFGSPLWQSWRRRMLLFTSNRPL